jgi:hypothetical protein
MAAFIDGELSTSARRYRERLNPLEEYSESDFYRRYRFSKACVAELSDLIRGDLPVKASKNCAVPIELQLMTALRYYATGSYQIVTGDTLGLSQPTVSRIVTNVSTALSLHVNEFIHLPTQQDAMECKQKFMEISGFPGVISCVDGTHIPIERPRSRDDDAQFINRKGFYSLNVQVACDASYRFTHLFVKYPGSSHDSCIIRNSRLWDRMEDNPSIGIVLGDSAYPCRWWLMTPYTQPSSPNEVSYNRAHKRARVTIENTIGQWKRRFGMLNGKSRRHLVHVPADIAACAVLHNFAKDRNQADFDLSSLSDDWNVPQDIPASTYLQRKLLPVVSSGKLSHTIDICGCLLSWLSAEGRLHFFVELVNTGIM